MDCQYEYIFVDPFDHYGFLSYCPIECIDPVVEKGINYLIADGGRQISLVYPVSLVYLVCLVNQINKRNEINQRNLKWILF